MWNRMITSFDHHTTKHKIPSTLCNLLPLDFFGNKCYVKDSRLAGLQRNFSTWESWLTPLFPLPCLDKSHLSGLADETAHKKGQRGQLTQPQHRPLWCFWWGPWLVPWVKNHVIQNIWDYLFKVPPRTGHPWRVFQEIFYCPWRLGLMTSHKILF